MSLKYIRERFGVPAYRGARVCFKDKDEVKWTGRITSATSGGRIRVLVDDRVPGYRKRLILHPTWHIEYMPAASGVMACERCHDTGWWTPPGGNAEPCCDKPADGVAGTQGDKA